MVNEGDILNRYKYIVMAIAIVTSQNKSALMLTPHWIDLVYVL